MSQSKTHKEKEKHAPVSQKKQDDKLWWMMFTAVVVLSFGSRLYKVSEPDHVCWDETHFGKMGSWYINRTFFFDVHPPLGKMLIALSGYLTGYEGTFPFEKPGDKYENVNYIGMRVFCAVLGMCIAPFGFLTIWEMTNSLNASMFSSVLILFDVGILTLTRYILLDPIFLFFMMGTVFGSAKFNSSFQRSFSLHWWTWLLFTGFMMACCISVKFVGLFTVILVGLKTIEELWDILGDLQKSFTYTVKHFTARFIGLVVFPILLYVSFFYIHLQVLNRSGNGDGFYSSGFQSKLIGNSLYNASMPRDVAYGAIVSLKNHRTGGGYLHSHWHLYPEGVGSRQQQITTYTHKDENNHWRIKHFNDETPENSSIELLKHGDIIRLEHVSTRRNLHSHREPGPVTKKHNQVTGYGEGGVGDANDVWKVLIVGGSEDEVVKTVTSKIKFVHYLQHCVLTTTGKQLPKWAYEQQEVTCNPNLRDKNSLWNVEDNIFPKLPNVSFEVYAPSFLERFIESHAVMFQGNAGLKPKEGEVTSRPWQWPINFRGQFFSGNDYKIYLLGNPVIWWSNLFFLAIFLMIFVYNSVRYQRGYRDPAHVAKKKNKILHSCTWLFLSWLLHYVPFWAMGRILYFHHYFPALLFSSMLSGVIISYVTESVHQIFNETLANTIHHTIVAVFYSSVLYSFYLFAPLSYGMSGPSAVEPNSTMYGLRWMESWEF
ncbi:protein O-mannosyl-transferase 2 [Planococcus citri]|uniref:protein O-mannosyl-transferase 2 n=1 Tax=Planococcus citri TaxID=170843 RepID=UPI0031F8DF43